MTIIKTQYLCVLHDGALLRREYKIVADKESVLNNLFVAVMPHLIHNNIFCQYIPTGHTLVESTLFPRHVNVIMLHQRGTYVELNSGPSG